MLRTRLSETLKDAMRARNQRAVSTVRLILAAIKDRDIAARTRGVTTGVDENEITALLRTMVKQRQESIALYQQGGRPELAQQEAEEIAIIEGFLPRQLGDEEARQAVVGVVTELEAKSLKDMGRVMTALRARWPGQMDFTKANAWVKELLTG